MEKETIRVNIRIAQSVKEYFEAKSKETGIAQSSLMALALMEYIENKTTVNFMRKYDDDLSRLNEVIKSIS